MASDTKRVRLELVMSQAIQDDFLTEVDFAIPGVKYTQVADAAGRGCTNPKLGDAVWPQLNTIITLYVSEDDAARALIVVRHLRERYKDEGIACFKSDAWEL